MNSKEKLLEIIERINIESERLFAETFHAVSKNFKSMFKRLFGDKATADLILQDESDPLECGIEVIAKPPGKKLQSISLMSGWRTLHDCSGAPLLYLHGKAKPLLRIG
ncbi:hypothetical protein N8578_01885 [Akkermansiaceae bacterium]|nr:hypothetical protein [Akkermansiaceae bacterium]